MTLRPSLLLGCAVLALAACSDPVTSPPLKLLTSASLSRSAAMPGVPTDQHIFVMNGNSVPDDFPAKVAAAGGTVVRVHDAIGVAVVKGLSDVAANDVARGIAKVDRDLMVQWVPTLEEVRGYVADAIPSVPAQSLFPPQSAFFLSQQWNMFQIHAPEAWSTPVVGTGNPIVRVAIIDTGLDPDHIDAVGLIDVASSIAYTPSLNGPPAWADDQFHGTHVGGIVTTNNIGTAGVAPNVTLIAIKVLNASGTGTFADVIAGLVHAATVHANVANLSLGALFPKNGYGQLVAALNKAVNYANAHGVLVVASAGNDAADLQHDQNYIEIPCESGTGMCVSSTGPGDLRSSFSNYGVSAINVAAPGGEVTPVPPASWVLSPCSSRTVIAALALCRSRARYLYVIGTSEAAPHVSGLAALLDSQYGGMANPAQLQTRLQQCSDDIGKPGADPSFGQGRINALKTVTGTGCNNSAP